MIRFVGIVRTLSILCNNQYNEMMKFRVNNISRLIAKKFNVNEHVNNMSSYRISFFKKLILCREFNFSPSQKVSPIEIQASFEKAYWKIHVEPLLEDPDEKELHETLHQILPEEMANSLSKESSRLAHLYSLHKTHKATLSMRPILSATGTYNYNLAKWLEEKLKPVSINVYTIVDAFAFVDEIRTHSMNEEDILVSYEVTALFTDVPLDESINILVQQNLLAYSAKGSAC